MKRIIPLLIAIALLIPRPAHAAPLCSDGSAAPGGNICNCAVAASIGGSSFTPAASSGLAGNTFGGIQFSGIGGALASCTNIGGTICGAASSLFGGVSCNSSSSSTDTTNAGGAADVGQSVPIGNKKIENSTKKTADEEAKTTRREQCLNGAAYAVAKTALQKLSDKTLNWVRTGLGGNPFYVRDVESYLTTIKNEKLKSYLNTQVVQSNPIFGNALESVIKENVTGYTDNLFNKAMNTPEAKQYAAFQEDFTNGGWGALLNMNNNPVGAYFKAIDSVSNQIGTAQQNVKDELQQGEGFLSMRKCVEYAKTSTSQTLTTYNTLSTAASCAATKEAAIQAQYNSCMELAATGQSQQDQNTSKQICEATRTAALAQVNSQCSGASQTANSPSPATRPPTCLRYEVVTPGSIISNQLKGITNSSTELLINADQINEVLGSFFDQLMNRLFSDGVSGIGRGSTSSFSTTSGGFGANVVIGTNGLTLNSAESCQTPLGYNTATGGFNDEFDISRPQQLKAVIETQRSYLTRSQDAQYKMQEVVPVLGALDYCIPGPNPTWNIGLNENAQSFLSQLQEARQKGNNSLVTIGGIVSPLGGFGIICSIFSGNNNCNNDEHTTGWYTSRATLFDKVDGGQKRITDRAYGTGAPYDYVAAFFNDTFTSLKTQLQNLYSDQNIINAFVSVAHTQSEKDYISDRIEDAIALTGNLTGFAQGIAQYNETYKTNIKSTQDALVELEDIYKDITQNIVGPAKARYILEMSQVGTPVNLSCINNAYKVDPLGPGVPHLENITGTPNSMIQQSLNASTYFYNNL